MMMMIWVDSPTRIHVCNTALVNASVHFRATQTIKTTYRRRLTQSPAILHISLDTTVYHTRKVVIPLTLDTITVSMTMNCLPIEQPRLLSEEGPTGEGRV